LYAQLLDAFISEEISRKEFRRRYTEFRERYGWSWFVETESESAVLDTFDDEVMAFSNSQLRDDEDLGYQLRDEAKTALEIVRTNASNNSFQRH
jgi:hypothetical protein